MNLLRKKRTEKGMEEKRNTGNYDMTQGEIVPALVRFSIPVFLGNLFQQLYNVIDIIIVGRCLGEDRLAAVGVTGTISFLMLGFAMGLSAGFSVITSQKFGAKDLKGIKQSVASGVILLGLIGLVITIVMMLVMKPLLHVMNTPQNIFRDAYRYIMVICIGFLTTIYYNLFASYLRAVGNSKAALYFLLLASGLNIVLDLVFIKVCQWGVAGAAIATVVSQLVSVLMSVFYIWKKERTLVPSKEEWKLDKKVVLSQIYIGVPMALQYGITSSGTMVMQAAVNIFDSVAVAAYTAAGKCVNVFMVMYISLGQSMATYCGQNYGNKNMKRIKEGVFISAKISTVYSVVAGILICVLLPWELQLFFEGDISQLLPWARVYIYEAALFFIPLGYIFIFRNAMQGYGCSMLAMLAGIVEMVARFACAGIAMVAISWPIACFCDPAAWLAGGVYTMIAFGVTRKRLERKEIA